MNTTKGWCGLPKVILFDDRLTPNQKLLYCYIESLTHVEGFCFASNGGMGKVFSLSSKTISEGISKLTEYKYLFPIYENEGTNREKRKIYTTQLSELSSLEEIVEGGRENSLGGIEKNVIHNKNKNNNNIIDKSIMVEHIKEITSVFPIITSMDKKSFAIKRVRENKDLLKTMESKGLSYSSIIESIRKLAKKLDEKQQAGSSFRWTPLLDSPSGFLNNWQKVVSNYNALFKESSPISRDIKSMTDEEKKKLWASF